MLVSASNVKDIWNSIGDILKPERLAKPSIKIQKGDQLIEEKELHSRGYLVPLMNQILTGTNYEPPSDAPLAIIICPDWPEAQSIANISADLGKGM